MRLQSLIVCGADSAALLSEGVRLAAEWLCREPASPCGHCRTCRKAFSGQHVDITLIDEGPDENIKVASCRALRQDSVLRPFDGDGKVFVIAHAQNLNPAAQNALLTLLEEPPPYLRLILLTQNIGALLPTVRSRCAILRLPTADFEPEPAHWEQAERYVNAFSSDWERAAVALSWEKLSRTELFAVLNAVLMLLRRQINPASFESAQYLTVKADRISACMDDLRKNASVGAVCGVLALNPAETQGM